MILTRPISLRLVAASLLLCAGSLLSSAASAQSADTLAVGQAVERLRLAMIDPQAAALDALLSEDLSYGHSGGRVDSKARFKSDLLEGKSDFVNITLSEQSITVLRDVALVRHQFVADTLDGGKPGHVEIKILLVWQRNPAGQWQLIARQAVRPPPPPPAPPVQ